MVESYFSKDLLLAIRQLSPSMLLLSLTLHGLVLLIPFSLFPGRKIPYSKTTSKHEQIFISQSESSQFFTDNKALVKQKDLTSTPIPTKDPQFTSQLPSPPQDATVQTQLPIPEIQVAPTASSSLYAFNDLTKEIHQRYQPKTKKRRLIMFSANLIQN
ncbi:hypothetical protein NIES4071_90890 [Calothrix sp. NIES-4071]|nr:hypothetical protein NIES4071_90890 [Calothrix sp. NIES-4071]BAZ63356.1 hypothetical protein NIES4105_90820 [Calothrix sp. NIES-4105]